MERETADSTDADGTGEWAWSGPIENPSVPEIADDPLCEPHPAEPGVTPATSQS